MLTIRRIALSLVVTALAVAGIMAEKPATPLAVRIAAHSHLDDATALANKNTVMSGQNAAVTRSNIRAQQDDVVSMQDQGMAQKRGASGDISAKTGDMPTGLVLTGDTDALKGDQAEGDDLEQATDKKDNVGELTFGGDEPPAGLTLTGERDMLTSPDAANDGDNKELAHEQFGGLYRRRFFYPGFRGGYYGWRYPLPYWRRYGRRFYRGPCPFGRIYGGYYYC